MGKLLQFKKKPSVATIVEKPAEVDLLEDHRLLMYHAKTQGLNYKEYRSLSEIHNVPLETAIENARNGIAILDYVRTRERRIRTLRRTAAGFLAVMSTLTAALVIYTMANRVELASEEICKKYITQIVQPNTDETTKGQTEYYCLLAQQEDPKNNLYRKAVESERPIARITTLETYVQTF